MENQGIQCHIVIPENTPPIFGVRDQIQQVFFNLILNSMDAMENVPSNRNIWIEAEVCDKDVCIYVEDSGPGIPEEIREKLFEPFASSKKNGTGLGLAVSYGVVEAHGGRLVLAESRHGQGACFQIQFPIAEGE